MVMDVLQNQVVELSAKVDALHGLITALTEKVSNSIEIYQTHTHPGAMSPDAGVANLSPAASRRATDPSMSHKDILSDEPYLDSESSSTTRNLSPEIQIQRLTAQLTAAYNRIAALEEQVMAYRSY